MMHQVATPTHGELPGQAAQVGIAVEQVALSTRQAAAHLFPKERGLLLLTLLLLSGEVQKRELNGHGLVDVAVIRLQSIELFAQQHQGWSKDTALRYIAILEALQILQRSRHAEYTELHVPLIPWSPSETALAALDELLVEDAAREKLQQLASSVKARFLLLYGTPHSWSSLFDDLLTTLTDVQDLLHARLSTTKRHLLQLRIENLKVRLEAEAQQGDFRIRRSAEKGDFRAGMQSQNGDGTAQKGDFQDDLPSDPTQKGDFQRGGVSRNSLLITQKGDFHSEANGTSGPGFAEKGDFHSLPGNPNGDARAEKGDFHSGQQGMNRQRATQKGDFQGDPPGDSAQKGDFQGQSGGVATQKGDFQGAARAASLNDNVITLYNDSSEEGDDSDNDAAPRAQDSYSSGDAAKVGRQLALFLEKSPQNIGGFVNKCKQCSPTVIRASVIDVLVHAAFPQVDPADERGRPKNRASWFHDACKKYGKPGTCIPAFIEKWHKTDLAWDEIERQLNEAALRYKRYMIADRSTADLVRKFLRGEIEQLVLDEALQTQEKRPQSGPQSFTSAPVAANGTVVPQSVPQAEKTWMDEYEAEALAEEILRDAGPLGVSKAVARQEQGVYVVALIWRGSPISMKAPQEWRSHLEKVRPLFERERMSRAAQPNT